jgi:hypothetical protein
MKHCKKCKSPFITDSYCPSCGLKDPKNNIWMIEIGLVVTVLVFNLLFKLASNNYYENTEDIDSSSVDETHKAKAVEGFAPLPKYSCIQYDKKI